MSADRYDRFAWDAFEEMSFTELQIACSVLSENSIVLLPRCICGVKDDGSRVFVIHSERSAYDSEDWRRSVLQSARKDAEFVSTSFERVVIPSGDGCFAVHEDQSASVALRSGSRSSKSLRYYLDHCGSSVHRALCRHLADIVGGGLLPAHRKDGDYDNAMYEVPITGDDTEGKLEVHSGQSGWRVEFVWDDNRPAQECVGKDDELYNLTDAVIAALYTVRADFRAAVASVSDTLGILENRESYVTEGKKRADDGSADSGNRSDGNG